MAITIYIVILRGKDIKNARKSVSGVWSLQKNVSGVLKLTRVNFVFSSVFVETIEHRTSNIPVPPAKLISIEQEIQLFQITILGCSTSIQWNISNYNCKCVTELILYKIRQSSLSCKIYTLCYNAYSKTSTWQQTDTGSDRE